MGFSTTQMAQAGMMTQAAGIGYSAIGAYNKGQTQQAVMNYESGVANNNAQMAQYQSQQELQLGAQMEEMQRLKNAQNFGATRAALAANGVDLGSGSANAILAGNKQMGDIDALTIRDNAARRAWAYQAQASNYMAESSADQGMGRSISPLGSTFGSLLTGAGSLSRDWQRWSMATKDSGS